MLQWNQRTAGKQCRIMLQQVLDILHAARCNASLLQKLHQLDPDWDRSESEALRATS